MQELDSEIIISNNQRAFATALDIEVSDYSSVESLVEQIENKLGQNTLLELARWFVMSVLCHSNRAPWQTLDDSGIASEKQYEIARLYIEKDEFKQSLRTVLKEDRCKFTLLRFAKSRNLEKRVLSTTTKAFKHAQGILKELELVAPAKTKTRTSRKKAKPAVEKESLVDRRAARRGYFDDELLDFLNPAETDSALGLPRPGLSDEEFAELDAKIDVGGEPVYADWSGSVGEDRSSLLVGLAAGCVMFAVVIWMFV